LRPRHRDTVTTNISISDAVWEELNSRKTPGDSFDDVLRRALDMAEGGNSGDRRAAAEDAVAELDVDDKYRSGMLACWEYLREKGEASPSELREEVHSDHDAGASAEWWWRQVGPGLEQLPGVARPSENRFEYRR